MVTLKTCVAEDLASAPPGAWTRMLPQTPTYEMVPQIDFRDPKGVRHVVRWGPSVWDRIGLEEIRRQPLRMPHNYGSCGMKSFIENGVQRPLYDWKPRDCQLLPLDNTSSTCNALLGTRSHVVLLVVGDSTAAQTFLALCLLMQAKLGRNAVATSTITRLTASACNDRLRLSFVRNDMLIATTNKFHAFANASRCVSRAMFFPFIRQLLLADLVVFAIGQHMSNLVDDTSRIERHHLAYDFFTRNLNATLSVAQSTGWLPGRDPRHGRRRRVVVLGPTLPMPGCSRAQAPAKSMREALAMEGSASPAGRRFWPSWVHNLRLNEMARWIAKDMGVGFVNVAELTARRADDAMGRNKWSHKEDCVHYCMPGVPDTIAKLVYNALTTDEQAGRRVGRVFDAATQVESVDAKELSSWESLPGMPAIGDWLSLRGVTHRAIEGKFHPDHAAIERIEHQEWWPFGSGCSGSARPFDEQAKKVNEDEEDVVDEDERPTTTAKAPSKSKTVPRPKPKATKMVQNSRPKATTTVPKTKAGSPKSKSAPGAKDSAKRKLSKRKDGVAAKASTAVTMHYDGDP